MYGGIKMDKKIKTTITLKDDEVTNILKVIHKELGFKPEEKITYFRLSGYGIIEVELDLLRSKTSSYR